MLYNWYEYASLFDEEEITEDGDLKSKFEGISYTLRYIDDETMRIKMLDKSDNLNELDVSFPTTIEEVEQEVYALYHEDACEKDDSCE